MSHVTLKNVSPTDIKKAREMVQKARIEIQNVEKKCADSGIPVEILSDMAGMSFSAIPDILVDVSNGLKTLEEQAQKAIDDNREEIDKAIKLLRSQGFTVNFSDLNI